MPKKFILRKSMSMNNLAIEKMHIDGKDKPGFSHNIKKENLRPVPMTKSQALSSKYSRGANSRSQELVPKQIEGTGTADAHTAASEAIKKAGKDKPGCSHNIKKENLRPVPITKSQALPSKYSRGANSRSQELVLKPIEGTGTADAHTAASGAIKKAVKVKKIPAWDTIGRLKVANKEIKKLKETIAEHENLQVEQAVEIEAEEERYQQLDSDLRSLASTLEEEKEKVIVLSATLVSWNERVLQKQQKLQDKLLMIHNTELKTHDIDNEINELSLNFNILKNKMKKAEDISQNMERYLNEMDKNTQLAIEEKKELEHKKKLLDIQIMKLDSQRRKYDFS